MYVGFEGFFRDLCFGRIFAFSFCFRLAIVFTNCYIFVLLLYNMYNKILYFISLQFLFYINTNIFFILYIFMARYMGKYSNKHIFSIILRNLVQITAKASFIYFCFILHFSQFLQFFCLLSLFV